METTRTGEEKITRVIKKEHNGQTKKKREKEMITARIWQNKRQLPGIPGDL